MRVGAYEIGHDFDPTLGNEAVCIGVMTQILASSSQAHRLDAAHVMQILLPSVKHRTFSIYSNKRGEPIGYAIWAYLTEYTESLIFSSGELALHDSEWTEGDRLWIVDFVCLHGGWLRMARELEKTFRDDFGHARYIRIKQGVRCIKELSL